MGAHQGYMFRSAFLRKVPLFIRNFSENVLLCLAAAAIESTANRFLQRLKLTWRGLLTSRVHRQYFSQMVGRPALLPYCCDVLEFCPVTPETGCRTITAWEQQPSYTGE